ncbi:recombinase family protein [Halobacillus yeomjeoni]|uniref:Recombinase family protein n=1 Tax=Halobacillus yeomjeoni TaxID=311194 RepID=A0A931HXC8_9BACI|nr:recombinase family protein [Halobacillus yeomjeoni]MBH0231156.1 recombinase family protein [Halobacillus yeomjeoni]
MEEVRVACYYRVSTKKQLINGEIPLQMIACRDFVCKSKWKLVKEYNEKGFSGFKNTVNERPEMQRMLNDAKNKLFDTVLCFMFDRVGRNKSDITEIFSVLEALNINVISVTEGLYETIGRNNITNLQSNLESLNLSTRVNTRHQQLTREGRYRGGTPPIGYKLIPSGEKNESGKDLLKLAVDDEEAEVVRKIFELAYKSNYGQNKIAKYLNERILLKRKGQYSPRKSTLWNASSINTILRNPIYTGVTTYGKRKYEDNSYKMTPHSEWTYSVSNPELKIIEKEVFDHVQMQRSSRTPRKNESTLTNLIIETTPLILIGKVKCNYCNSPLTTTYNTKSYKRKSDGVVVKKRQPKYRCSGKSSGKTNCEGQTLYSQKRVEENVIINIKERFNTISKTRLMKKKGELEHEIQLVNDKKKEFQYKLEKCYESLLPLHSTNYFSNLLEDGSVKSDNDLTNLESKVKHLDQFIIEIDNEKHHLESIYNKLSCLTKCLEYQGAFDLKADNKVMREMIVNCVEVITVNKETIDVKYQAWLEDLIIL